MQNPWSRSYTLIPLDKRADHRPIGVGEVLRRIAGKAVMILLRKNVLQAARLLRLCRGQVAGSEYLWFMIHAMHGIFNDDNMKGWWTQVLQGVPKGSILGTLLFNIYLNDLFFLLDYTEVCNFADDTTFFLCLW